MACIRNIDKATAAAICWYSIGTMLCADNVQHLGVRLCDKAGTAGDKLRQFLGFNYQYVFHSRLFSVDLFLL